MGVFNLGISDSTIIFIWGIKMIYSDEQIKLFGQKFREKIVNGDIKKHSLPNNEDVYFKGADERDLKAILDADIESPLFKMKLTAF